LVMVLLINHNTLDQSRSTLPSTSLNIFTSLHLNLIVALYASYWRVSQEERAERVLARAEPSATERFFVITSKVSPSLPSVVSLVVVVWSVFQLVSQPHRHLHYHQYSRDNSDLRRDPWCFEDLPWGCHPW
jgi:hypothetical protein